jgi:Putative transposase DNA-binding domain.
MVPMKRVTTTLKLKFLDLNAVKADLFAQTVSATTELANELLRLSPKERKALTTAKVVTPLKSALSNQVIRLLKGKAGKRAKQFQVFWPEVNNQNWKLHKVGNTYSVSFPTIQGDKRVPLAVCGSHDAERLERVLAGQDCERGTLKLIRIRGAWYAVRLCCMNRLKPLLRKAFSISLPIAKVLLHKASKVFVQQSHLEQKIRYKLELAGRTLHKRPAAYTSKTDHRTGLLGKRNKHRFTGQDGYRCDADWNAAVNLAQWDGFSCPLSLKEAVSVMGTVGSGDGVFGNPLNSMNDSRLEAVRS